jgi:hypothetical protein
MWNVMTYRRASLPAAAVLKVGFALSIFLSMVVAAAADPPTDQEQERSQGRAERYPVQVKYVPPKEGKHQPLYEMLKQRHALESLQQLLSPFRWPRPLTIKVEGCDGEVDAWYDDGTITVCYEYLDDVWRNAPKKTTALGLAPIDAVLGPLYDVFLHESAHAMFDLMQVPILGAEEDAADYVSAFLMLQLGKEEARRLILGTAYAYSLEFRQSVVPYVFVGLGLALLTVGALLARLSIIGSGAAIAVSTALYLVLTTNYGARHKFADEHGTPAQRFYDLLCIAYGANPTLFADLVEKLDLPQKRAEGCGDEYEQVAFAFNTLIRPHVDSEAAEAVLHRNWLPDVNTRLTRHPGSGWLRRRN